MSEFKPYYGDTPYPIASCVPRGIALPVAEVTLATPYPCHSCMGYRFDVEHAHTHEKAPLVPCSVCGNRGAVMPGEAVLVDVAASHSWERDPSLGIGRIYCLARLRSPWPGRGGWYRESPEGEEKGTASGSHSAQAFGASSLRMAAEVAAIEAVSNAGGLRCRSLRWLSEIEWPTSWPVSRRAMDAVDRLMAELDMPASRVVRG